MSSLFLLPVPRDAQPPIDIWKRTPADIERVVKLVEAATPLLTAYLVTDSDDWSLKHVSLYPNIMVYRSVEEKMVHGSFTRRTPGEVQGVYELVYNKMMYNEESLGMISKTAWPHLLHNYTEGKSVSSASVNKIQYVKYIRVFDNPFEEIAETFYFKSDEEMDQWRSTLSTMRILNINFKTKYVVQVKLDSGGYSKVYLIKNALSNTLLAAKAIILEKFVDFDKAKEVIVEEIEAMHKLSNSAYTPRLFEVHQVEEIVYLVMEYIEGVTLGIFIRDFDVKFGMNEEVMHSIMM